MNIKEKLFRNPHLVIKKSPVDRYGVFTEVDIAKNEMIEECYSITGPNGDMWGQAFCDFVFGNGEDFQMLPLGYGSLYNHSDDPNANYIFFPDDLLIVFKAIKPIKGGEEIFVNYGAHWFSARDKKMIGMEILRKKQRIKRMFSMTLRFSLILSLLICVLSILKFT